MQVMNINRLDLNLLVLFDRIYQQGQLTAAAQLLHLSQPAVSHGLNRLRKSLSDPLFVRDGKTLTPTARAHELAPIVRQALDLIEGGVTQHQTFEALTSTRRFNLHIGHYAEVVILPGLLQHLAKAAPELKLTIHSRPRDQLVQDLLTGRLDLVIDYQRVVEPRLQQKTLMREDFVTVAASGHQQLRQGLTLSAFTRVPHVVYQSGSVIWVDQRLSQLGLQRNIIAKLSNFLSVFPLLAPTGALSTPPRRIGQAYASRFDAQLFEPPIENLTMDICQYWLPVVENDAGHRWLRNTLTALCAKL